MPRPAMARSCGWCTCVSTRPGSGRHPGARPARRPDAELDLEVRAARGEAVSDNEARIGIHRQRVSPIAKRIPRCVHHRGRGGWSPRIRAFDGLRARRHTPDFEPFRPAAGLIRLAHSVPAGLQVGTGRGTAATRLGGDADRNHGGLLTPQFGQTDGVGDGVDRGVGVTGVSEVTPEAGPLGAGADESNAGEPIGPDRRVAQREVSA